MPMLFPDYTRLPASPVNIQNKVSKFKILRAPSDFAAPNRVRRGAYKKHPPFIQPQSLPKESRRPLPDEKIDE